MSGCYNCGSMEREFLDSPSYPPGVNKFRCGNCGEINDPPGL
jgi:hypothetical protein